MNTDISNTFIHHIIDNRIRDLSNNPRAQFLGMLVNILNDNNLNSNLAMLPLANNYITSQINQGSSLNRILNNSLSMEKNPYKRILSSKGQEQLKTRKYKKDLFDQDSCCIMFTDFTEGQDIIQLPCNHIFEPEGIKTWLKEESSKCPICRYELDFKEVKETDSDDEEEIPLLDSDNEESANESQNIGNIDNSYNQLFQNISFINSPIENIFNPRPRRPIINQRRFVNQMVDIENQFLENRIMQNAIIASIYEQNGLFNTEYDSTPPESFSENDLELEDFNDDDI